MRSIVFPLLLALGLCTASASDPQPPLHPEPQAPAGLVVPELPSADMRLSWSDFRELLQLLQPVIEVDPAQPAPPPWPWSIASARYQIDATAGDTVQVEATYEFEVWADTWTTIPILGDGVALRTVQLDGEPAQLRNEEGWFTIPTDQPGHHRLEVQFFVRPAEQEGDVALQFPVVPAAITEVQMRLGADAAAVSSPDAAHVALQPRDGGQEAVLALKPAESLQLNWRRPSRVREKTPPPPPRITAQFTTQARLSQELIEGTTRVTFDVLRGTTNQFALALPKGLVLLDVSGKGLEWTLEDGPESQRLQLALNHSASGAYPVTLRFEQPLPGNAAPLSVPKIVALDVARQGGLIGISALRNTSVGIVEPTRGVSRMDPGEHFDLGLDWAVLHAFRYSQVDYELTVAAEIIEPRIVAETELLASVSATAIHGRANLRFQVLRGETRRFAFTVPADVSVLSVTGPGMDWYAVEGDGSQRIDIELNEPAVVAYDVQIALERDREGGETSATIPPISVHDVVRQQGWLGITAAWNVKIDVGEAPEKVTRIDETELPPGLRALAESPVLHAFEYQVTPFVLPLHVMKLDDVAVRVAAVDSVELTTVVTEEMLITRARYWVRNNQRQYLRIDPGPAVEIWGAQVDGHVASPAKDPESETAVLLRMRKSREGTGGLGSFPVELIYMQRPPESGRWRRTVSLRAPVTDILVDRLSWTVYVPEDERLASATGDLRPTLFDESLVGPDRGAMTLGQPETIRQLREGIERFLITDINNPAGTAASQSKAFTDRRYPATAESEASVRLAGVLPVHINLPQTGLPHRFDRVLVPQGEALRLTLRLHRERTELVWLWVGGLSAFLFVLALRFRGRLVGQHSGINRWRVILGLLLILMLVVFAALPLAGSIAVAIGMAAGGGLIMAAHFWSRKAAPAGSLESTE